MVVGGQLHEISERIGMLTEGLRIAETSRTAIHEKLDDISDGVSRQNVMMSDLRGDMTAVQRDMAEMRPKVERFESMRNKIAGALAVVSLLAGGAGAAVAKLLPLWIK